MAVKRKYRLNLRNYGNLPAIMLSQYDEGYALEFEIRDGTDAASDLSAYTVTLKGTRADTLAYSFAGTVSTNVLTFVIDTTMTACAGRGTAEIAIKDTANDVLFATFNMPVFVERAAVPEGSIDADVERAQEIAEQIQEIVDNAAAEVKGEAESWAVGQRDGTDVPATDPTYHNNAKYYSEQAQQAADSIGIDATLTQAGKAADAKKTGDEITELKEDFNKIANTTENLFDKTQATLNKQMASNGVASDAVGIMYTDFIPVHRAETVITKYFSSIGTSVMVLYSSSKSRVGSVNGVRDGDYVTYTVPDNSDTYAYGIINNAVANLDTLMVVEGTTYPTSYIPYGTMVLQDSVPLTPTQENKVDSKVDVIINKTVNLFDKTNPGIINGYFSGSFNENDNYRMTNIFSVKAGTTYKYTHSPSMGGNYQVALIGVDGNFTGSYVTGTYADGIVSFTPNANTFVRFNIGRPPQIESFMLVESGNVPNNYVPYGYKTGSIIYPTQNFTDPHLLGKKIVFDGDSICRGAEDTTPGNAYPQRVGDSAGMEWYNVGVSGGTIAVVSGVSHNLCTYIDTLHNSHPTLDYLILEGGTNDADRIPDELGTLSDNFDGVYDTSTFYGGIETLFYKAINYYPSKKIGFIVAMKMDSIIEGRMENRRAFFDAAIIACKKWGIPYLDLWNTCIMNPRLTVYYDPDISKEANISAGKFYADGQHPTAAGYDFLSPIIKDWIAGL